jgi:hypothetical protein
VALRAQAHELDGVATSMTRGMEVWPIDRAVTAREIRGGEDGVREGEGEWVLTHGSPARTELGSAEIESGERAVNGEAWSAVELQA